MYDIPELERKWKKYKRNQIKKPIIIGTIALVILAGAGYITTLYLNNQNKTQNNQTVVANNQAPKTATKPKVKDESAAMIIQKVPINSANANAQKVVVKQEPPAQIPQPAEVNEGEIDISKATIVKTNVPDDEIRVIGFDDKEKEKIKQKYEDVLIPKQNTKEIKAKEMLAEVEERFKVSQDPKDSLFLARQYYKMGDYQKAEIWAINTNNIDGDIEESWLIFAKARAKQGDRVDAIKVLQSYYEETNSKKAKELLDKLRLGKKF